MKIENEAALLREELALAKPAPQEQSEETGLLSKLSSFGSSLASSFLGDTTNLAEQSGRMLDRLQLESRRVKEENLRLKAEIETLKTENRRRGDGQDTANDALAAFSIQVRQTTQINKKLQDSLDQAQKEIARLKREKAHLVDVSRLNLILGGGVVVWELVTWLLLLGAMSAAHNVCRRL